MSSSSDVVLKNPPCFRTGLMWGIAVASAIGAHRFRTYGTPARQSTGPSAPSDSSALAAAHQTREFMEVMNNPERKAEAEQFLRSRVETRPSDQEQQ
ncbi:hypothetical protein GQ600_21476 [Phytophthora cactorum]|nr:hypothetical protein GQ600_21476 [Phytophthora cactorum]